MRMSKSTICALLISFLQWTDVAVALAADSRVKGTLAVAKSFAASFGSRDSDLHVTHIDFHCGRA